MTTSAHTTTIRRATESDVSEATDVFLTSLHDLRVRMNFPATAMPKEPWQRGYDHVLKTGVFYVAEQEGKIVGVCNGIVRDSIFFLSGFWALPEAQGQRIGPRLTEQVWKDAANAGAETYFVWASIDMRAMAQYMRLGMLPGYQLFTYSVPSRNIDLDTRYVADELKAEDAAAIDVIIRGTGRLIDHHFFLETPDQKGFLVKIGDDPVGYYYAKKGAFGPVAWIDTEHAKPILNLALAASDSDETSVMIPGCNHEALKLAIARGGKLMSFSHFFTSKPFGKIENYLSSGPLLF